MFSFEIKGGSEKLNQKLSNLVQTQIPFATSKAMNETGKFLIRINKNDMKRKFTNANAYTLNAFHMVPSTKRNLVMTIKRKEKPVGRHYLEVQDKGGLRPRKGIEKRFDYELPYNGIFMAMTPTSRTGGSKNNILMSQVDKVSAGINQPYSKNGVRYFVAGPHSLGKFGGGNKTGGIYRVTGKGKPQKMFHILDHMPRYKKKTDFHGLMNKFASKHMKLMLKKTMKQALRTAKLR
jgi:hypothetical protein